MDNSQIAKVFYQIAEFLEMKEENPFKIRAYEKAARTIESYSKPIMLFKSKEELEKIPGVGESIAEKIIEILNNGACRFLEELKEEFPPEILTLNEIPGLGPKKSLQLYKELKIKNIQDLEKSALSGKIRNLKGFGEKTESAILKGIELKKQYKGRLSIGTALPISLEIIESLKNKIKNLLISEAGSLRRRKDNIGDIDILASGDNNKLIIESFIKLPLVKELKVKGETKVSILTLDNLQVDLRVVEKESFGAALQYFTGSKQHNIELRQMAESKGFKINEYGIFKLKSNQKIAGAKEEEIYQVLGLPYIPPEIRETGEEIKIALKDQLPNLINLKDLKGDLHFHSNYSEGVNTLEEIAASGQEFGYNYIALTDHSQSLKVANGMPPEKLKEQIKKIRALNKKLKNFQILAGAEVDILIDGALDYPDNLLKELDLVVGSIHSHFKQDSALLTKRICKAMQNPYLNIIAHPSGRLLGEREELNLNWEEIFKTSAETNTALEINAYPQRLDLKDLYCREAKVYGCKFAVSTDSHNINSINSIKYGINVARRGWLEKTDVINTKSLKELLIWLKSKR
ncbi:MAG: DNA polymerase/3'-5' exonuclease PolX [Armatimonadetes bacterium]|nr:DNA polymerase/3'-5' exonuclease PolX [Armatimonadota bacterium]